jgi:purine-binding chemotaxis protein CheW
VIITEVTVDNDTTVLGCLADSVQEVLDLLPADISAAPKIGTKLRTDFIQGMGRREDAFIIILDIDKIFSTDELALVQAGQGGPEAAAK